MNQFAGPDPIFDEFLVRLRSGEEEAARLILHRFTPRLTRIARSRLDPRLRKKLDPEDVLQAAYRSFFSDVRRGRFEFHDWQALWRVLALITHRKCLHLVAYFHAEIRNVDLEIPLDGAPEESILRRAPLSREPAPEESAVFAELLVRFLDGLTQRDREIVTLQMEGVADVVIAQRIGRSVRTVERARNRAIARLQGQYGA